MHNPNILAIVLARGEGTRLHLLTAEYSKPVIPFAGRSLVLLREARAAT